MNAAFNKWMQQLLRFHLSYILQCVFAVLDSGSFDNVVSITIVDTTALCLPCFSRFPFPGCNYFFSFLLWRVLFLGLLASVGWSFGCCCVVGRWHVGAAAVAAAAAACFVFGCPGLPKARLDLAVTLTAIRYLKTVEPHGIHFFKFM